MCIRDRCTDAQGLVITYQYDGAGNLIHSSDNGGNSMDYTYDGAGNVPVSYTHLKANPRGRTFPGDR